MNKNIPEHTRVQVIRTKNVMPLHVGSTGLVRLCMMAAMSGLLLSSASGQGVTWDASGTSPASPKDGSATWSTSGTNWSNGTSDSVWTTGNTAVIGNNNGAAGTITVGTVSVANITFDAPGSGSYTLSGGTITLTSGTITDNNTSGTTTINSILAGSVGLTTAGSGTLALGGVNTFTGNTTIGAGNTLQIVGSGQLGSGAYSGAISDSGTLVLNTSASQTISGVISGTGSVTMLQGAVTLSGSSTYTGVTTITNGTLTLSSVNGSAIAGNITFGNGSSSIQPNITTTQANQFSAGTVITFLNPAGGYTRLSLDGNNQTIGGLSSAVGGAVVQNSPFSSSGQANATLTISLASGSSYSYTGILRDMDSNGSTSKLNLTINGAGSQTLVGSTTTNIFYSGSTTVNSGTLIRDLTSNSGATALVSPITINSGGVYGFYNTNTAVDGEYLSTVTINGSGTLSKTGAGYLDLFSSTASIKNFTGQINVVAGALASNNSDWSSSAGLMGLNVASGAYFDLRVGNVNIDALSGAGTVGTTFSQSPILSVGNNNSSSTFSGVIENTITAFTSYASGGSVGLTKNGTGTLTLTGSNTYTGNTTINNGTLTIGGAGVLGGGTYGGSIVNNGTLILASSASQKLTGGVTGSGLTQIGNGVTSTTVNDTGGFLGITGTLEIANGSTLAVSGANNLLPAGTATSGSNGSLVVDGTLQVSDGSAQTLSSTGVIAINNGTLLATTTGNTTFGSFYINGAITFTLTGSNTISGTNVLGVGGNSTLTLNTVGAADTLLVSGNIMNGGGGTNGGITKSGSGMLTLTGSNTYTGNTTINNGTLQIGNGGTTGALGGTAISGSSAGTLAFDLSNTGTFSNTISGSIGLSQIGSGTTVLTGAVSSKGPTAVSTGQLTIQNAAAWASGTTAIASGAVFDVNLSSGQTVTVSGTFNGSGTLRKDGVGLWVVGASGIHENFQLGAGGLIDIEGGGIQNNFGGTSFGSNLASINIASGAYLDLFDEAGQMDALTGSGTLQNGFTPNMVTATIGAANGSGTFAGLISGSGGNLNLTKTGSGTEVLTGSNTYTGNTTINNGVLQLGNGGTTGKLSTSSAITDNGNLAINRSNAVTQGTDFTGSPIIGTGGFTQAGSGVTTLTAVNTYSGTTSVTAGTLMVNGSLTNSPVNVAGGTLSGTGTISQNVIVGTGLGAPSSSVIAPSAGGGVAAQSTLNMNGNLTLNSDAAFQFKLDSMNLTNDALIIGGTLTLTNGPTLTGSDINNASDLGNSFIIAQANGGITGTFAGDPQGADITIGSNTYAIDYTAAGSTEIVLTAVAIPEPETWAGILTGFGMLAVIRRFRRGGME